MGAVESLISANRVPLAVTWEHPHQRLLVGNLDRALSRLESCLFTRKNAAQNPDGSVLQLWMSGCPVKWGYRVLPEAEKVEKLCRIYGRP